MAKKNKTKQQKSTTLLNDLYKLDNIPDDKVVEKKQKEKDVKQGILDVVAENNKSQEDDVVYEITPKGEELAKKLEEKNSDVYVEQEEIKNEVDNLKSSGEGSDSPEEMMDEEHEYVKARKIRKQKWTDLLADKLVAGGGIGESVKGTISEKFQAKLTGIKEKFDPLNIAKFMTGGSRLGPALLGKILGRNQEDIEHFAGKAKPVSSTATKISSLEKDNSMLSMLLNIHDLLRKNHEEDILLREKENASKEERDLESLKRHEKLLEALKKLKGGTITEVTAEKVTGDTSLLDVATRMAGLKSILSGLAAVTGLGSTILLIGSALSYLATGTLASPMAESLRKALGDDSMLGAMSGDTALAASILDANQGLTPEQVRAKQEEKKKALADEGLLTKIYGIGETEALKRKGYTQEQIDELRGDTAKKKQLADEKKQAELVNSFDKRNGDLSSATMEELEAKKAQQMDYGHAKGELVKSIDREILRRKTETATPVKSSNVDGTEEFKKEAEQFAKNNSPVPETSSAAPVPTPNAGEKLNSTVAENNDARINELVKPSTDTISNTIVKSKGRKELETAPQVKIAAVRNLEETFQRMIIYSTRVV